MAEFLVDVGTEADGSLVVRPSGDLNAECAVPFRQLLVHSVRRVRPQRLIVDLGGVTRVDAINLGTLSVLCDLGDDHRVAVFIQDPPSGVRARLLAAGVPAQRLRYARETTIEETPEVASMS